MLAAYSLTDPESHPVFGRKPAAAAEPPVEKAPQQSHEPRPFPPAGHASIRSVGRATATEAKVVSLRRDGGVFAAPPVPVGDRVRILIGTTGGGLEIDAVVVARPVGKDLPEGVRVRFERVSRVAMARIQPARAPRPAATA